MSLHNQDDIRDRLRREREQKREGVTVHDPEVTKGIESYFVACPCGYGEAFLTPSGAAKATANHRAGRSTRRNTAFVVHGSQFDAADIGDGTSVTDASSIGFAVGQWPDFILVTADAAEALLMERSAEPEPDGGYVYLAKGGGRLIVFND